LKCAETGRRHPGRAEAVLKIRRMSEFGECQKAVRGVPCRNRIKI